MDSAKLYFAAHLEKFAKEKKAELDSIYTSESDLDKMDILNKMVSDYMKAAYKKNVEERNSDKAPNLIKTYMLFEIARNIYSYSDAYQFMLQEDKTYQEACKVINEVRVFKKYKVAH